MKTEPAGQASMLQLPARTSCVDDPEQYDPPCCGVGFEQDRVRRKTPDPHGTLQV